MYLFWAIFQKPFNSLSDECLYNIDCKLGLFTISAIELFLESSLIASDSLNIE